MGAGFLNEGNTEQSEPTPTASIGKKITAHKRLGTNTFLISQNITAKLWLKIVSLSMLANQSEVMGGG